MDAMLLHEHMFHIEWWKSSSAEIMLLVKKCFYILLSFFFCKIAQDFKSEKFIW